ncbi:Dynamitin-domain-containing protein [Blyttiomyces helicus]|uniref:Dynamitin-domain-containing protein n=1 Tax=Blyttiomyces helicus TaxID=388810 RepID=A0A4P9VVH0_9FUNG|nr:Dynamitin-domain-containing protein [Blyttiomyces helicus]|eukprot:RKO83644.1 Dynamitin-domain-containing protein [Blyttiomyces helicus]
MVVRQVEVGKALIAQLKDFKSRARAAKSDDSGEREAAPASPATDPQFVTYELFYTPESHKLAHLSKLTELESRLTSLERLIGTSFLQEHDRGDGSVLQSSGSLIGALERLDHHLSNLAHPRQLDAVAHRVKSLTADLDRLADLRKKQLLESASPSHPTPSAPSTDMDHHLPLGASQTESERRVNHLFATLEKLDPVAGIIPHLVARLHGLRALHTEAAVFADSLKMLADEQGKMGEGVGALKDAVGALEVSVRENEERVKRNVESLEGRMEKLLERVGKLDVTL